MRRYTKVDATIMKIIKEYYTTHGYMPSIREIAEMVGLSSSSSVHSHINKLFDLGYLETDLDESDRCRSSRGFRIGAKYDV